MPSIYISMMFVVTNAAPLLAVKMIAAPAGAVIVLTAAALT
jgi:hypothetical protein